MSNARRTLVDIKQLTFFLHVAECGSLTRAQARLAVTPSILSRQIAALEKELNQRLFERNGRGVVLTEAGRQLLAHAQLIVAQVERARNEVGSANGELAGECRIGLPPTIAGPLTVPLQREFLRQIPNGHLVLYELPSTSVLEWLGQERIDFGFAHEAPKAAPYYKTPKGAPQYEAVPLLTERLYLVGPATANGDQSRPNPVAVRDLAAFPLVVLSTRPSGLPQLKAAIESTSTSLTVALEIGSTKAMVDVVEADMGYAIMTLSSLHGREGAFSIRPIVEPELEITLHTVVSLRHPLTRLAIRAQEIASRLIRELAAR
jgi:LysR family nitrogen assimilation transcriptional regulator